MPLWFKILAVAVLALAMLLVWNAARRPPQEKESDEDYFKRQI